MDLAALLIERYGVLGLVLVLLLARKLVPGWTYDAANAERERLLRTYEEVVIPALTKAVAVLERLAREDHRP